MSEFFQNTIITVRGTILVAPDKTIINAIKRHRIRARAFYKDAIIHRGILQHVDDLKDGLLEADALFNTTQQMLGTVLKYLEKQD